MHDEGGAPALRRVVSRGQILGLAINDVIGSGIYLLPAAAALLLGPASLWAVLLAGFAVALVVLCYAQAASWFDEPGASYLYAREAFGRFIGFEVGWMTWLTRVASAAALASGSAQALAVLWPATAEGPARALVIAATLALVTWLNLIGVKSGARTAVVLVLAKLVPLVLFVLVGIWFVEWSRLAIETPPDPRGLGEAALLLLFAYAGFENTSAAAGEYRDPKRDVPRALIGMIVVVTVLYASIQLVALGTLPGLAGSDSPLAEAAGGFAGPAAVLLLSAGAAVSIIGTLSNTTLFGPRYLYALARDGYGPRVLARIHPRWRTPAIAIAVQSLIALALALGGTFAELALLSIIARLVSYVGTAAAVLKLRRRFADAGGFVLPGGPLIPIGAIVLSLSLAAAADWRNLAAGAVALVVGALIYVARRRPSTGLGTGVPDDA